MNLITTPAYHTSNSYGTVEQADAYFATYSRMADDDAWLFLSDNQKEYALYIAAQLLNTISFRGKPVTLQQKLAFPRFTNYQVFTEGKTSLQTFYDIEFTSLIADVDFYVTDNKFIDTSSSANAFYEYVTDKDINIGQLIKVVRGGTEYLTIHDMDIDGDWIQVKEDIEEESGLTATIYVSDIYGFPDEVMWAQFEMAYQVVSTRIFQATVGENVEQPVQSFYMPGALQVRYTTEMFKTNRFENSGALDIMYSLLGNWIAGVKGVTV